MQRWTITGGPDFPNCLAALMQEVSATLAATQLRDSDNFPRADSLCLGKCMEVSSISFPTTVSFDL